MTDAWFHNAIATDSPDDEGCRPEEAHALKSYLRSLITIEECSRQLTTPTTHSPSRGEPLLYLWGLVIDALIEIPGCQQRSIDLLLKIQRLPDVNPSEEQRKGALSDRTEVLWRDLPGLANMWYDTLWWYYYSQWRVDITYACSSKLQHVKNIATAESLLAHTELVGGKVRYEDVARFCDSLEDSAAVLDVEIPILQIWMRQAGDLIWQMCKQDTKHFLLLSGKNFDEQGTHKGKRNLWQGEGGASVQRWQFWKQRLEEIVKNGGVDGEMREVTRETLEEMTRVDGSG